MKYRVRHITHYKYQQPVSMCYNRSHLLPRETQYQSTNVPKIIINPTPASGSRRVDYFGNLEYHFSIQEPHMELFIDVVTEIEMKGQQVDPLSQLQYGNTCFQAKEFLSHTVVNNAACNNGVNDNETLYAREFLLDSPMIKAIPALAEYAKPCFDDGKLLIQAVKDLSHKIFTEFEYNPESTNIATPLTEVLENKSGVCQDFAHLAIGCLRALGYPARYVSGYLETLPPPGQKRLVGADASHAWFAVYSPGEGWFEFDPTNDTVPLGQHIVAAYGRDYSDVSPLRGVVFGGGGAQTLAVSVDVARIEEG